jgi:hypothetical protein
MGRGNRVARKQLQPKIQGTSDKIVRKLTEIKDEDWKEQLHPRTKEISKHFRMAFREFINYRFQFSIEANLMNHEYYHEYYHLSEFEGSEPLNIVYAILSLIN